MVEEVVGQLIGAEGIDLSLIGPLSSLAETATDRLTLETLSGDVAVLDWQEPEAIVRGLAAVRFEGQRAPHPHDLDAPPQLSTGRRVFAFDMHRFSDPNALVAALRELNSRRQVRTFSIGIGSSRSSTGISPPPSGAAEPRSSAETAAGGPPSSGERESAAPPGDSPASSVPHSGSRGTASTARADRSTSDAFGAQPSTGVPPAAKPAADTPSLDLDDLLDQLDRENP